MLPAWLYDGRSAIRHEISVDRGEEGLRLHRGGETEIVPADRLVHVESRAGAEIYGRSDIPGWRLGLPAIGGEVAAILPARQRYGRWIDRIGLVPALLLALIVSGLVLLAGSRMPDWLAPLVPQSWEKRFGDALVGDFGGRFCEGPGGQAALDKLVRRLAPARGTPLRVRVVYVPLVNAAALPGGNIVIFDGLLKQADGPDELAGILAHEIAHVRERHTTKMMIRQLGLSTVVAAFGGTTGANIETLLAARYSRAAEQEADASAIRDLQRAGISPLPTAEFFQKLSAQEERIGRASAALAYLSTHPLSAERQRRFRQSFVPGQAYRTLLSRDEWDALFNICFNDPRRDQKALNLRL